VAELLKEYEVAPELLTLEVTETGVVERSTFAMRWFRLSAT